MDGNGRRGLLAVLITVALISGWLCLCAASEAKPVAEEAQISNNVTHRYIHVPAFALLIDLDDPDFVYADLNAFPPTLLLHGTADTDVPYEQSALMAAELRRRGIDSELITIDGGGHGFDKEMDDIRIAGTFDRVLAFLARHTAP